MPVKVEGTKIIEVSTGKVKAHGKTPEKARAAARIINQKHREKMKRKGRKT